MMILLRNFVIIMVSYRHCAIIVLVRAQCGAGRDRMGWDGILYEDSAVVGERAEEGPGFANTVPVAGLWFGITSCDTPGISLAYRASLSPFLPLPYRYCTRTYIQYVYECS